MFDDSLSLIHICFDFDGTATYTGGDIYINGEKQTEIVNSMPGGGGAPGGGGPQGGGPGGGHPYMPFDHYILLHIVS